MKTLLTILGVGVFTLSGGCSQTMHQRDPRLFSRDSPAGATEIGWADDQMLIFVLCGEPTYDENGVCISDGSQLREVRVNRASMMRQLEGATQIAANATGVFFNVAMGGWALDWWGPDFSNTNVNNVTVLVPNGELPVPR